MRSYRIKATRIFLYLFPLLFCFFPVLSFAAVFNVTNTTELRNALNIAQSNNQADTINIAPGTYNTAGTPFTYTAMPEENFALAIVGAGPGATILVGGNSTQVLSIDTPFVFPNLPQTDITIMNLSIQNGHTTAGAGGGLRVVSPSEVTASVHATITVENCEFRNNSATSGTGNATGGGVFVQTDSGNITLSNNIFHDNDATASGVSAFGGGAFLQARSGHITLTNNAFSNNSATSSFHGATGGGAEVETSAGGDITLINNTFNNNSISVTDVVGAIDVSFGGGARILALSPCIVENDAGDCVIRGEAGNIILTNNIFTNNTAPATGGATVDSTSGSTTLTNNAFSNNSAASSVASQGGADVFTDSGDITLINNTFNNNSAISSRGDTFGGGANIETHSGNISLMSNTFRENRADVTADPSFERFAAGGGSNITNGEGSILLVNNTFINNSATSFSGRSFGGGADISTVSGLIMVTNNTFTSNFSSGNGGGLNILPFDDVSTATNIYNNIVFNNIAVGRGVDIFFVDDQDGNKIGSPVNLFNNDFSDFVSQCRNAIGCMPNIVEGNNINTDPSFVDAANGDVHLQSSSPVINKGTPSAPSLPPTDFEGDPRIVGAAPDIGADEFFQGQQAVFVSIDVRPRSDANKINPNSSKDINVAIFSNNGFDATSIDSSTVRFGATGSEAAPVHVALRDVDQDGHRDLILRFHIQDTGFKCGDTLGFLSGQIPGGPSIIGLNSVRVQCRN